MQDLVEIVRDEKMCHCLVELYRHRRADGIDPALLDGLVQRGIVHKRIPPQLTPEGEVVAYNLHEWEIQVLRGTIVPQIKKMGITASSIVADLGCGGGQTLLACTGVAPCRVIGFDRNPIALRLATAWMQASGITPDLFSFSVADIHSIPLPDNSCTHVICRVVLQKLSVKRALSEAVRILQPGGRLFLHSLGPGYYLDAARRSMRDLAVSSFALANGLVYHAFGRQICVRWRRRRLREVWLSPGRLRRHLERSGMQIAELNVSQCARLPSSVIIVAVKDGSTGQK